MSFKNEIPSEASSTSFIDEILEIAMNAPEELKNQYDFYLGDPEERADKFLERVFDEIIVPLRKENDFLKAEIAELKKTNLN